MSWRRALISTAICLGVLLGAEGLVGWLASASYEKSVRGEGGYTYPPNLQSAYRNMESGRLLRFSTNSLGLHDSERPWRRQDGIRDVAVIGNSFVDALQVAQDERFTSLMERNLAASRVFNLGIQGQSLINHADLALWAERTLRPDLVVILVTVAADFGTTAQTTYRDGLEIRFDGASRSERRLTDTERARRWVLGNLRRLWLVRAAEQFVRQTEAWIRRPTNEPAPVEPACPAALTADAKAYDLAEAILADLRKILGDRLLVALLPHEAELAVPAPGSPCAWNRAEDWLAAFAARSGTATLSLRPILAGAPASPFYHKGHLNPLGHQLVAQALNQRIGTMAGGR